MVKTARIKDRSRAMRNTPKLISIRKAKFCSHLFITKYAMGQAMILDRITSRINSLDIRPTILRMGAPSTFRMAISLVRRSVENETNPDDGGGTASVIITLVNIEEDRISKNPDGKYRTHNAVIQRNPEILINLYVLFSVNTGNYLTSISRISTVIQCFQSTNFFNQADFPTLESVSQPCRDCICCLSDPLAVAGHF